MRKFLFALTLFSTSLAFAGNEGGGTSGIIAPSEMDTEAVRYIGEDQIYTYFVRSKVGSLANESTKNRIERLTTNPHAERYLNALDESKKENNWVRVQ